MTGQADATGDGERVKPIPPGPLTRDRLLQIRRDWLCGPLFRETWPGELIQEIERLQTTAAPAAGAGETSEG